MAKLIICALIIAGFAARAPAAPLILGSPEQGIAAVAAAIADARAQIASLPPAKTDAERLERLARLDRFPREVLSDFDLSRLDANQKEMLHKGVWAQIDPIDAANQAALLKLVPAEGWFSISRYGLIGSSSAFLIVQHANLDLWRRFLPVIEKMAKTGEVRPSNYALMYDRLALKEGRPQRYGSQMTCQSGRWAVQEPIEDPAGLEARRKALGMPTMAENAKSFQNGC